MLELSRVLRRERSGHGWSVRTVLLAGYIASSLLAGCSDADDSGPASPNEMVEAPLLAPPKQGRGIQITMDTALEPGVEVERCRFVRTGDAPLIVNHDEVRFTAGSHHVLLFLTSYDQIPTQNLRGEDVDTSAVFDCSEGVQGLWRANGLIAASQSAEGDSAVSLPAGVGVRVPANAVVLVNAHYINTMEKTLEPRVFINLHSIPENELEQEGGLLFWYNPFLKAPANGNSKMRASCPLNDDIHITNAQSHMHRRGVGYTADMISAAGERTNIYQSDSWESVVVKRYTPNLDVAAGSRIEWECEYQNAGSSDIYQGPTTKNEMCMFIGSYYPRNDDTSFCTRNHESFMGAKWEIGSGKATCAETFQCIAAASMQGQAAPVGAASVELTSRITECLLASRADQAGPVSEMLGCLASAPDGSNGVELCGSELAACTTLK
jgi:hypothetical protein